MTVNKNSPHSTTSRSKGTKRKKKNNVQKLNKPKGILLEKIVAAFYNDPDAVVERNVKLFPASGDKSRKREIDVLITARTAGTLTSRFAFQCKNEKSPIEIDKIDSFVGALDDVGIPRNQGIFVSVNGFSSGAIKRAKEAGIRTLIVKGLTEDRLRSETIAAVQHSVFLIPRITEASLQNSVSEIKLPDHPGAFYDKNRRPIGSVMDLILGKWLNGEIPAQLGQYEFEMEAPEGWFQYFEGKNVIPQKISAKAEVLGVVISTSGEAENHRLIDAETQQVEKFNTSVQFRRFKEGEVIPLQIFTNEDKLKEFIEESEDVRLSIRNKLHRIIYNNLYYPFSEAIVRKMYEHVQNYRDDFSPEIEKITKAELWEISQNDLFTQAELGLGGMPLPVITTDDNGDLVDVTLLFNNEEYDKIIALRPRYENYPFKPFGDLIAWSYLEKSKILFAKAQQKVGAAKERLITGSLNKINAALEVDPRMLAAVDHLSTVMFYVKNYPESLRALEYIISREPEDVRAWADQALVLMRQNNLDKALEAINKAERLAKKQKSDADKLRLIHIRRAMINYEKEVFPKAWKDLLIAWKTEPLGVVENASMHQMFFEIIREAPTIEGYLLKIEILLFAAAEYFKAENHEEASRIANDALTSLESVTPIDQAENVIIAQGVVNNDWMNEMLTRIAKYFFETGNKEWANEQISRIHQWAQNKFRAKETFLDEFKIS